MTTGVQAADNQIRSEAVPPLPHLKTWREGAGFTMRELGEAAGVGYVTVFRLEHGQSARVPTLRKIAAALGITPAQLIDGPHAPPRAGA